MSTGDQNDFVRRLRGLLPRGWFPDPVATGSTEQAPVLVGILSGFGSALAGAWTLLQQVRSSTRLSTSTGSVLDLAANDLFGVGQFPRTSGEADASYLARIKAALVARKNTRDAVASAVAAAGATSAQIIECWNAADCGSYAPARPAPDSDWRPLAHLAPIGFFGCDVQQPIYVDGVWHLWFLWNGDYPTGNGTAWRHLTSPDLLNWTDQGVSIPKYQQGQGDPWTGSVVIDTNNTAGFGAGAYVAVVTMAGDAVGTAGGAQSTFLWYTLDLSQPFTFYGMVQQNPNANTPTSTTAKIDKIFRDPSVFWDAAANLWMMVIGEIGKIGFYTSPDLKNWTATGSMATPSSPTYLECPKLVQVSGSWVLFAGGNGSPTTGTYYWTGAYSAGVFTPDNQGAPVRLDYGPDFYAAAIWADSSGQAYTLGWVNNWGYADTWPDSMPFYGCYSTIRKLALSNGTITQVPLLPATNSVVNLASSIVTDAGYMALTNLSSRMYVLSLTIGENGGSWAPSFTLAVLKGGSQQVRLTFDPAEGTVTLDRSQSGYTTGDSALWNDQVAMPVTFGSSIELTCIIDSNTVELFVGGRSMTALAFSDPSSLGVSLFASDGASILASGQYSVLNVAAGLPWQRFPAPSGSGLTNAARGGYSLPSARYTGVPGQFFVDMQVPSGSLAAIRSAINSTKAAGVIGWLRNALS
ncbi:levanase [Gluconobacter japonicus]|nr:levanase [Gluconobacter japonicus]